MTGPIYEKIEDLLDGRQIVAIILHGSHIYGLNNENSDLDVKAVYLSSKEDILLGRIKMKSTTWSSGKKDAKNSKDDVDIELFSIHTFINLLRKSDSGAISMLFAPIESICMQTPIWRQIVDKSDLFCSRDMIGLLGFIKSQISKYCDKGVRLNAAIKVLDILNLEDEDKRMADIWNILPEEKYLHFSTNANLMYYSVCDRLIQDTVKIGFAKSIVQNIIDSYGDRSIKAMKNNGFDWKAISHAFRVATELTDLYKSGKIIYPIKNFNFIKQIKSGSLDFDNDVLPKLNTIMDDVYKASESSNFPQKINNEKIDEVLFSIIEKYTI